MSSLVTLTLGLASGFVIIGSMLYHDKKHPPYPYGEQVTRMKSRTNHLSSESHQWREAAINDAIKRGTKKICIYAGEYGEGLRDTSDFALQHGISVTTVAGPFPNDDEKKTVLIKDLQEKIQSYGSQFGFYAVKERPQYHFTIIGPHLFLEEPHPPIESNIGSAKYSLGIWNAYDDYLHLITNKWENLFDPNTNTLTQYKLSDLTIPSPHPSNIST